MPVARSPDVSNGPEVNPMLATTAPATTNTPTSASTTTMMRLSESHSAPFAVSEGGRGRRAPAVRGEPRPAGR